MSSKKIEYIPPYYLITANNTEFKTYTKNVINNAKVLSKSLSEKGFKIFSGGTDTHLMLLDLRSFKVTGNLNVHAWTYSWYGFTNFIFASINRAG